MLAVWGAHMKRNRQQRARRDSAEEEADEAGRETTKETTAPRPRDAQPQKEGDETTLISESETVCDDRISGRLQKRPVTGVTTYDEVKRRKTAAQGPSSLKTGDRVRVTAPGAHNGKRATVEEHTDKRVRIKFDHDEGQACLAEE
eukprot:gene15846-biopygen1167